MAMPSGTGGGLGAAATAVEESTSSTFITCQPLGPRTPAQTTVAPGLRSSCPDWRSVVTCRNASLLSLSRAKNPYPLTALNHLTLPRSSTVSTSPPISPCWVVICNDPVLLCRNPITPGGRCNRTCDGGRHHVRRHSQCNQREWLDVPDRPVQGEALSGHRG